MKPLITLSSGEGHVVMNEQIAEGVRVLLLASREAKVAAREVARRER